VNAIEVAFTFTETLLGKDFTRITVSRKRKRRKKKDLTKAAKSEEELPTSDAEGGADGDGEAAMAAEEGATTKVTSRIRRKVEEVPHESDIENMDLLPNARGNDEGEQMLETDDTHADSPVDLAAGDEGENDGDKDLSPEYGDDAESRQPNDDVSTAQANATEERNASERSVGGNAEDEGTAAERTGAAGPAVEGNGANSAEAGLEDTSAVDVDALPGQDSDDESEVEDAACIEGTDVIRRFASPKTLQHIALAIRAALCNMSGISGSILPVPEGAHELYSLPVVAKSLVVLQSVWKVVGSRDRGAFRCAYYNFGTMHLFGVAMAAAEKGKVSNTSILGKLAELGRDVTQQYFKVLTVNPALLMDTLFFPEVSTQRLYASKMHQVEMMKEENEKRARGELIGTDEDSDDDEPIFKNYRAASKKRTRTREMVGRQRRLEMQAEDASARQIRRSRSQAEDTDEDVDDLDNLDILQRKVGDIDAFVSAEEGNGLPRQCNRRPRGKTKQCDFIAVDSDEDSSAKADKTDSSGSVDDAEVAQGKSRKNSMTKKKPTKRARQAPAASQLGASTNAAVHFSSDDEYSDGQLAQFAATNMGPLDDDKDLETRRSVEKNNESDDDAESDSSKMKDGADPASHLELSDDESGEDNVPLKNNVSAPADKTRNVGTAPINGSLKSMEPVAASDMRHANSPTASPIKTAAPADGNEMTGVTRKRRVVLDDSGGESE
jgi:hypothetical protein